MGIVNLDIFKSTPGTTRRKILSKWVQIPNTNPTFILVGVERAQQSASSPGVEHFVVRAYVVHQPTITFRGILPLRQQVGVNCLAVNHRRDAFSKDRERGTIQHRC